MVGKLPKITLPRTSDGFAKKLNKLNGVGIKTRKQAYEYAYLMLESINFELKKLEEQVIKLEGCAALNGKVLLEGLIERYKPLQEKWQKNLQYTIDHFNEPIKINK